MTTQSDEQWMERVAAGDARAFDMLVRAHLPRAYAIARRILLDPQDAEDAAQEAFTKVWVKASSWQPDRASFSTWLYRIVVNCALDLSRRRRPEVIPGMEILDTLPDPAIPLDESMIGHQERTRVQQAVATLSVAQRTAVVLCYFEEMSNAEAAAIMGLNVKALEGLLVRARKALRGTLGSARKDERHAA